MYQWTRCIRQFSVIRQTRHPSNNYSSTSSTRQSLVLTEKLGQTFLIGINRPEKRNCINHETAKALVTAFDQFQKDDSVTIGVLYGVGGHFSSGYDLKEASSMGAGVEVVSMIESQPDGFRMGGPTGMKFTKPVIAAVEGYAVGLGLELAIMCDIRVVDETTRFGLFNRRFGVPLLDGGTVRLPKLIGLSRAMDMILSGREVDAKTAFEWGLANRLVTTGAALGQAVHYATSLARFPQICMNADRRSTYYAVFDAEDHEDAFCYEWQNGKPVVAQESVAGATRFAEGIGRHGSFSNKPDK